MDYIQTGAVEKVAKFQDKGLDPNYHDPDTGGESLLPFRLGFTGDLHLIYCEITVFETRI